MGSNNQYLKVGYQGDIGSFSEEAMYEYFTRIKENKKYNNFEDLFIALNENEIEYAVLPIENSSTGSIRQVYDLLNQYDFYIVGEECIKIEQHLIGIKGACIDEIKEIYSHPQGFEQSSQFLKKYNEIRLIPYLNTAISAKYIS
ncbi:bifunctional chorismate mutase/prephenate dehydratase, partial [Romboutsia weinsteinii]